MTAEVIQAITVNAADGSFQRARQTYFFPANLGKAGGSSGYLAVNDTGTVKLPASTGASTWVIPITLHKGDIITSFKLSGQLEASGNANVLDADLRTTTAAAAALTDASIGAITQISEIADYKIIDEKTGLSHAVITGNSYYVLLTGTTLAATDQDIQGVEVTVNQR